MRCLRIAVAVCAPVALALFAVAAAAAEGPVVRVEEDWELVLRDPEPSTTAPQVTTVMVPAGDASDLHMTFEINHQTEPNYTPGGIQLQAWYDETLLTYKQFSEFGPLDAQGDAISWTQSTSIGSGILVYEIEDGNSTTWGAFGGEGTIRISVGTYLTDLADYCPHCSVDESGVSFSGNRVERLVIKEIRRYGAAGLIDSDSTDRVVYQHD